LFDGVASTHAGCSKRRAGGSKTRAHTQTIHRVPPFVAFISPMSEHHAASPVSLSVMRTTIFAILVLCQPAQELEPRLEPEERFQRGSSIFPPLEGDGADHHHWRRVSIAQFQRIYYSEREMSVRSGISAQVPPQCWWTLSTERPPARSLRTHFPLIDVTHTDVKMERVCMGFLLDSSFPLRGGWVERDVPCHSNAHSNRMESKRTCCCWHPDICRTTQAHNTQRTSLEDKKK
jgi:hypothetical protein